MSQFWRLLRLQLDQRFGLASLRTSLRERRAKTLGRFLLGVLVFAALGSMVALYVYLLSMITPLFLQLGIGNILLGLAVLISSLLTFFMGMVYLIGTLFFARDIEFLAALPIPQRTVFAAKFAQVLVSEIGTGALVLLPALIVYGIQAEMGAWYWVTAALATLTAPCVPLALSALLSLVLMRLSALWRRRDLLVTLGSLLLLTAILAGQGFLTSTMSEDIGPAEVLLFLRDSSALLARVCAAYPPAQWAVEGMHGQAAMMALFLAVSLAAVAMVFVVSGRMYYAGAQAQRETAAAVGKARRRRGGPRAGGPMRALFVREWRTALRSPVYALNGLLVVVLGPLLLAITRFTGGAVSISGMDDAVNLFSLLNESMHPFLLSLLVAAVLLFISCINTAGSTTVSREGPMFFFLRTIPVSPARQAAAKFLFAYSVLALTSLLMTLVSVFVLQLPAMATLLGLALALVCGVAPIALSMLPDFLRPKLAWNSETEAIKQNMCAVLAMFIGWGYLALLGVGCYFALRALEPQWVCALAALSCALLGVISLYLLCRAARRSWRRIEG